MGTTAEYVMIDNEELEKLLASDAQKIIDDLYDERWGFRPRFEPTEDTFQKEIAANPFTILNHEKVRTYMEQILSNVREQQSHSQQRLHSGDRQEQIDEICKLYAWGQRRWQRWDTAKVFGGLSEDELALEAIKRGYHLRFDLDKSWDTMHEFLTGITLREKGDEAVLASAMPSIKRARSNASFPVGCVLSIEEARNAIHSMNKEVQLICRQVNHKFNKVYAETGDCPDDLRDLLASIEQLSRETSTASRALYISLMNIAALQKDNDDAAINANHAEFMAAEKCAQSIQSLSTNILLKIRASVLDEPELVMAKKLREEAIEIKQLLTKKVRERPWSLYFTQQPKDYKSISEGDLLSMAVSGGKDVPGLERHEASYVTVDHTRAIAALLESLTSDELARQHALSELADWEEFYQFKKFYLRAAQFGAGVLVFFH